MSTRTISIACKALAALLAAATLVPSSAAAAAHVHEPSAPERSESRVSVGAALELGRYAERLEWGGQTEQRRHWLPGVAAAAEVRVLELPGPLELRLVVGLGVGVDLLEGRWPVEVRAALPLVVGLHRSVGLDLGPDVRLHATPGQRESSFVALGARLGVTLGPVTLHYAIGASVPLGERVRPVYGSTAHQGVASGALTHSLAIGMQWSVPAH